MQVKAVPRRPPSLYQRRAWQFLGRSHYVRRDFEPSPLRPHGRGFLAIAYTGVRRPCICTGCICLTPGERARQRRVFALARAWHKMLEAAAVQDA